MSEAPKDPWSHEISATYSFPKAFIAVVQLLYASFTLYSSFGSQIETYGYAAFGLTVTPYALMSLINLIGGWVTPSYPAIYFVRSSILDEAAKRGSVFDGVVGTLREIDIPEVIGTSFIDGKLISNPHDVHSGDSTTNTISNFQLAFQNPGSRLWSENIIMPIARQVVDLDAPTVFVPSTPCFERQNQYSYRISRTGTQETLNGNWKAQSPGEGLEKFETGIASFGTAFISALSLAIIGGMSGFHARHSSILQRIFTMAWVTCGIYMGSLLSFYTAIMPIMSRVLGSLLNIQFWYVWMHELAFRGLLRIFRPCPVPRVTRVLESAVVILQKTRYWRTLLIGAVTICSPSIGGLVVVGIMMHDFGICE
jgi:hypothetical protein